MARNESHEIKFQKDKLERTGQIFKTNDGEFGTIIEYFGWDNCTIKFRDGTYKYMVRYSAIKNGSVKNPMSHNVYGVGFVGVGKYESGKHDMIYGRWSDMIKRCYNPSVSDGSSYNNCSVDSHWHNFQNYAKFFIENHVDGFDLDKDILFAGNKIYSEKTCRFVPKLLNNMFVESNASKSGLPRGVFKHKNRFKAYIGKYGEKHYLGTFRSVSEAESAYNSDRHKYIMEVANIYKDSLAKDLYDSLTLRYDQ